MSNLQDAPSGFSHPCWRLVYSIVTCGIIGGTVSPGSTMFAGFFMLAWGLLFDYSKFKASTKFRRRTKVVGLWLTSVTMIVNGLAILDTLIVSDDKKQIVIKSFVFLEGTSFPTSGYWLFFVTILILWTGIDWVAEYQQDKSSSQATQTPASSRISVSNHPSLSRVRKGGES